MPPSISKSELDGKGLGDDEKPSKVESAPVLEGRCREKWYQFWLPYDPPRAPYASIDDAPDIPVATASFLNLLTFSWITEIMIIGWQRPLQIGDLWKMDESRKSQILADKLGAAWDKRRAAADRWNASLESGEKKAGASRRLWWKVKSRGDKERIRALDASWRKRAHYTPNLVWALSDVFGFQFWLGGLFKITGDMAQLGGPLVSKVIIQYAQKRAAAKRDGEPMPGVGRGVGAAVGLFCLTVTASICQHQWFWRSMSAGILGRAALINSLYKRGLALSPKSRTIHPNGALVNHLSTDISRIDYLFQWAHPAWTAPIQVIVCVIILCVEMGPSALAGFSLFLLLTPLQERAMTIQLTMRRRSMKYTDQRANLLQEILGAMRITKLFTYEKPFWERISAIRKEELSGIRTLLMMRAATQAIAFSIPVLAGVLAFVVYALSGHSLNPAIIFTSLSLFQLLRQPLMFMPRALSAITDGRNALSRISKVFLAETLDAELEIDPSLHEALIVRNASFKWEAVKADNSGSHGGKKDKAKAKAAAKAKAKDKKEKGPGDASPTETLVNGDDQREPFSLNNLSLSIPRGGRIHAIVGPIGSGKSSVLNGLIGEMRKTGGEVLFGGKLAYCAQIPWIQNATLRNNVIFGREFDEERYWNILRDACLIPDLELLSDGDLTEIGEKGINLSGGQKARVNLARALYSDADIIALDDPLSAVDAHVAEKLFADCILALRNRGKTVVLVTHALHFLPQVDHIYCLVDGHITEEGAFDELIASQGAFSDLMRDFGSNQTQAQTENDAVEEEPVPVSAETKKPKTTRGIAEGTGKIEGILIKKEVRKTGHISGAVYKSYIKSGGGAPVAGLVVATVVLMQVSTVITSYWLVWWQETTFHGTQGFYMGVYAALGTSQAIFTFALGAALSLMSYLASAKMHGNTLRNVLHAPMSFFDTTPLGRILTIFGKDMDTIDNTLSDSLRMAIMVLGMLLGSVILISILFPYFLPIVAFVFLGYLGLASFYTVSSREMKRIDGILRSSLYSHFAESLSGLATIRAYGATSRFIRENGVYIDHEDSALYLTITNQRWLSIRLDAMGGILTFVVGLMAVEGLNGVSPAQIGLALSYTVQITQMLGVVMRQMTEVENNMNAVERVFAYSNEGSTPQEAAYEDTDTTITAPPEWPARGEVDFKDVYMSYRPGLPPVLKGVDLHVDGGQKIGVVGRTGAGKSSMMAVLFRLIEISSGSITIDGLDISKLGLKALRSHLSIIPQDPLIFSGTIRTNLDPFSQHEDAVLWDALRRARVTEGPSETAAGEKGSTSRFTLDTVIDAEGANLSVGERSLLSLARALCKDSQVVVMDEATASVDLETDSKIQETILKEFKHKTVLCIAHRLRTIINYQKILVMDQGRVVEYDTPLNLYDHEDGIFRSMCERSQISRKEIEAAWKASSWADAE